MKLFGLALIIFFIFVAIGMLIHERVLYDEDEEDDDEGS